MTTTLDLLTSDNGLNEVEEIDYDNLPETILDLSKNLETRLLALEEYYKKQEEDAVEIISRLNGMYQMSGISVLETFLYKICTHSELSAFLKLQAAKSLLEYEELTDEDNNTDEIAIIKERNQKRKKVAGMSLHYVCYDLEELSSPCKVEAIYLLMSFTEHKDRANTYFHEFINDNNIDCEFRYRSIINLENNAHVFLKDKLLTLFTDKVFVKYLLVQKKNMIKKEFPKFTPTVNNEDFFELLIQRLSYDSARELFKQNFPKEICEYYFFIKEAFFSFIFHSVNMTYYKVLAGQYLLQKCSLTDEERLAVENQLVEFASDPELDYDRRADAADVLLQLGSAEMKARGREIIMELGRNDTQSFTVFDNAQNVHVGEVEASVAEILEFFAMLPLHMVQKKDIEFDYVQEQIKELLKKEKEPGDDKVSNREEKIYLALNRIYLDRALYSNYNNSLSNILLKVWSYIIGHECEEELLKRLLEELEDMSGTCSTGFASRLVNVISGFGDFNIRISWEDQIIANFKGRLNALARKITDKDGAFYKNHHQDVVELMLNLPDKKVTKDEIVNEILGAENVVEVPKMPLIVEKYLSTDREVKINECLEYFAEAVLNEMSLSSSLSSSRQCFSLFLRSNIAYIREEMYAEFTEHLDDTSFDLYMRKAIMHYEGEI